MRSYNFFVGAVPQLSIQQAGNACVCRSQAWEAKIVTSAWWVSHDQVLSRGVLSFRPQQKATLAFAATLNVFQPLHTVPHTCLLVRSLNDTKGNFWMSALALGNRTDFWSHMSPFALLKIVNELVCPETHLTLYTSPFRDSKPRFPDHAVLANPIFCAHPKIISSGLQDRPNWGISSDWQLHHQGEKDVPASSTAHHGAWLPLPPSKHLHILEDSLTDSKLARSSFLFFLTGYEVHVWTTKIHVQVLLVPEEHRLCIYVTQTCLSLYRMSHPWQAMLVRGL